MAVLVPDGTVTIPLDLRGRAIVAIALQLIGFWARHRATLAAVIDTRLTAVFDSLADAVLLVQQIARPGPD